MPHPDKIPPGSGGDTPVKRQSIKQNEEDLPQKEDLLENDPPTKMEPND